MSSGSEGDGRGPPPQPLQHGCQFIDPSLARPARHHCRCRTALSPSPLPLQYPSRASPDETESTVQYVRPSKQHNNYHFNSVQIVILRSLKVRKRNPFRKLVQNKSLNNLLHRYYQISSYWFRSIVNSKHKIKYRLHNLPRNLNILMLILGVICRIETEIPFYQRTIQ